MVARAVQGFNPYSSSSQLIGVAGGGLNTGVQRFDVGLGLTATGDTVVSLPYGDNARGPGGSLEAVGPNFTIAGDGWHTYSLVYDPTTELANLFVDGLERLTGYSGNMTFLSNSGLYFGASSGGQGDFNFVQITSAPEPSSVALLLLGGAGLFVWLGKQRLKSCKG